MAIDRSGSMDGVAAGFAGQDVGMNKTGAVLTGLGASLVNAKTRSMPSKMQARAPRCTPASASTPSASESIRTRSS